MVKETSRLLKQFGGFLRIKGKQINNTMKKNHTLKYWRTEDDFNRGEAHVLSTELSLEDALDVYQAFIRIGRHYEMEIYETDSGETVEQTF